MTVLSPRDILVVQTTIYFFKKKKNTKASHLQTTLSPIFLPLFVHIFFTLLFSSFHSFFFGYTIRVTAISPILVSLWSALSNDSDADRQWSIAAPRFLPRPQFTSPVRQFTYQPIAISLSWPLHMPCRLLSRLLMGRATCALAHTQPTPFKA